MVPDPLHQDYSPYIYCGTNPVNRIDPLGLIHSSDDHMNDDGSIWITVTYPTPPWWRYWEDEYGADKAYGYESYFDPYWYYPHTTYFTPYYNEKDFVRNINRPHYNESNQSNFGLKNPYENNPPALACGNGIAEALSYTYSYLWNKERWMAAKDMQRGTLIGSALTIGGIALYAAAPSVYSIGLAGYAKLSSAYYATSAFMLTQSQRIGAFVFSYGGYYLDKAGQFMQNVYLRYTDMYYQNEDGMNSVSSIFSNAPLGTFIPRDLYFDFYFNTYIFYLQSFNYNTNWYDY